MTGDWIAVWQWRAVPARRFCFRARLREFARPRNSLAVWTTTERVFPRLGDACIRLTKR
jgi:hypothetical protein